MKKLFFACFLILLMMGCQERMNMEVSTSGLEKNLDENTALKIRSVEFPEDADWFNVPRPLTMKALRGKIILLDFWTYCCINCMHVIADLKKLEDKYPDELAVIGVHSAKFANEKDSENIRQSILRYEVKHPVFNDPSLFLWQSYGVSAWPTLVLINAEGHLVFTLTGEGHYEVLDKAVSYLIKQADKRGLLDRTPILISGEVKKEADSILRFPGKVFADSESLIISDSNHNRILVSNHEGKIIHSVGNGNTGFKDGNFDEAEFRHPQGVYREGDFVFVADTENHAVRKIDLNLKMVTTLAGTRRQGTFLKSESEARKTSLNSPWDLIKVGDKLYIAMAGAHQIWNLNLKNAKFNLAAGSGREDLVDGEAKSAALAQPSGLAYDAVDKIIYFADSEVSGVRKLDLRKNEVATLVGKGLFEFGDQDGPIQSARLQHPLGVFYSEGRVYVADTYNDKIKVIDVKSEKVKTISGSKKGLADGKPGAFYEPGGLSGVGNRLFIADTNNHAVRILDLKSDELSTVKIDAHAGVLKPKKRNPFLQTMDMPEEKIADKTAVALNISLPVDHEFTEEAPFEYEAYLQNGSRKNLIQKKSLNQPAQFLPLHFDFKAEGPGKQVLEIRLRVPYCSKVPPKVCKFKSIDIMQPFSVDPSGKSVLNFNVEVQ